MLELSFGQWVKYPELNEISEVKLHRHSPVLTGYQNVSRKASSVHCGAHRVFVATVFL